MSESLWPSNNQGEKKKKRQVLEGHKGLCDRENKDREWKNQTAVDPHRFSKFSFLILNSFNCTYFHGGKGRKERHVEVDFGEMIVKSL